MGIKERREREKQATRQLILDAARELFVNEGYEAVTMRRVAEKIEYSPTAIYVHFKDKAALMRELVAHDFLRFAESLNKVARVQDPLERLRKLGRAYLAFAQEHPATYKLLFMQRYPPEVDDDKHGIQQGNPEQDAYAFLQKMVQEAKDAGCFKPEHQDVDLISQTLWGGLHGLVSLHLVMKEDAWLPLRPLGKSADLMLDLLLGGFARPPGSGTTRAR
ncbi:TetR/AcrR family transcriptional regulator [Pyxidicoccus fallax]|uniref:TetR/AcrR family transcriptional regulator n=1 Tax=Pyxidicoccus fallax TaxID=394095 RepID=A0A848L993_9BACT|nr:TetR/AcrR family transcriptional regulator [Pyxidicoccus fallax]NMO15399.1 TetR/AcrR family transcriptional regulator [Pyxidicoccus fallax]NPC80719.1 TetR/AcrR family transcriptional regulator [Pyxidicoccus fallax]